MQHHRSIERSHRAIQPVSPASYGSSMEITPYNPAVTPTSSIDLKGRIGETSQSLKTSTELLKVLNRIWTLEEQHVSNMSIVRALKKELDHARSRIKELVREQQTERLEMDDLMKQIKEDTIIRKNKEQDRINAAILSLREELENERRLRKRSESLHRKLARELSEVKTTLDITSKELEKERKSSKLLEDLCDEFALGIRDYEQELHSVRQKYDKDWAERADQDRLILHVSESWLDERMQMKLEPDSASGEKKLTVEKMSAEIEAFLRARSGNKTNGNLGQRDPTIRRNSLESIPLNAAVSAPQDEDDEDDSAGSDSNCFELAKPSESNLKSLENEYDETLKDKPAKKKVGSSERTKGPSPSSLQVKFEERMARAMSDQVEDAEPIKTRQGNPVEISISQKSEKREAAEESSYRRKNKYEGETELSSNYMIDNLIRNHYLLSESGKLQPDNDTGQASIWRSRASPVRQWTATLPSHDLDISESSSKLPPDSKEHTLKAKLLEARTRGQRSRSRLKASIIPSRVE
ncbi:Plasma membrane [Olea europaea subsp. europaea]|nr:Plasma membrane [Olea europaea subsp. europaea]